MTMNVVLGDGLLPGKELEVLLKDMQTKANKEDDPFWFLVHGKAEPTATDTALMKWLTANDIYYEMISDGSESDIYEGYQNNYTVKRLAPKIVSLMKEVPEDGEGARLLALFASDDPDADEDAWLNDILQSVTDAGFPVLAMNDGMQEVRIVNTPDEIEDEEEEAPVAPAKPAAASKKAAAKPAPVEEVEEAEPLALSATAYSREELEEMDLPQLKAAAEKVGIELPPRTRMATYVEAILGNLKDEEVEVITMAVEIPEDGGAPIVTTIQTPTSPPSTTNGAYAASNPALIGQAMLIVVYNGTVVSKAITEEEARSLV